MNEKIQIIFGLLGGLAVFIYGMNMMSECLQRRRANKMKSILATSDEESASGRCLPVRLQPRYSRAAVRRQLWRSVS